MESRSLAGGGCVMETLITEEGSNLAPFPRLLYDSRREGKGERSSLKSPLLNLFSLKSPLLTLRVAPPSISSLGKPFVSRKFDDVSRKFGLVSRKFEVISGKSLLLKLPLLLLMALLSLRLLLSTPELRLAITLLFCALSSFLLRLRCEIIRLCCSPNSDLLLCRLTRPFSSILWVFWITLGFSVLPSTSSSSSSEYMEGCGRCRWLRRRTWPLRMNSLTMLVVDSYDGGFHSFKGVSHLIDLTWGNPVFLSKAVLSWETLNFCPRGAYCPAS